MKLTILFLQKKRFCKTDFADKIISFLYSSLIKVVTTNKAKGIAMSKSFINNLKEIIQ